jgi:hypothetical protein
LNDRLEWNPSRTRGGTARVLAIAAPILIPFLGVLAIQIPVKDLLQKLAKGLL